MSETTATPVLYREDVPTYQNKRYVSVDAMTPEERAQREAYTAFTFNADGGVTPEYEAAHQQYLADNGQYGAGWDVWRSTLPTRELPEDMPAFSDPRLEPFKSWLSDKGRRHEAVCADCASAHYAEWRRSLTERPEEWEQALIDQDVLESRQIVEELTEGVAVPDAKLAKLRQIIERAQRAEAEREAMRVERDNAQEYLRRERQGDISPDDPRLQHIWDRAHQVADDRGYCEVYDSIAEEVGIPPREVEFYVDVDVTLTVSILLTAPRSADAYELGNMLDDDTVRDALEEQRPSLNYSVTDWTES